MHKASSFNLILLFFFVHNRCITHFFLQRLNRILCCKWLRVITYKLMIKIFISQLHNSLVCANMWSQRELKPKFSSLSCESCLRCKVYTFYALRKHIAVIHITRVVIWLNFGLLLPNMADFLFEEHDRALEENFIFKSKFSCNFQKFIYIYLFLID